MGSAHFSAILLHCPLACRKLLQDISLPLAVVVCPLGLAVLQQIFKMTWLT